MARSTPRFCVRRCGVGVLVDVAPGYCRRRGPFLFAAGPKFLWELSLEGAPLRRVTGTLFGERGTPFRIEPDELLTVVRLLVRSHVDLCDARAGGRVPGLSSCRLTSGSDVARFAGVTGYPCQTDKSAVLSGDGPSYPPHPPSTAAPDGD